jgi:predicted phosphodiesterase
MKSRALGRRLAASAALFALAAAARAQNISARLAELPSAPSARLWSGPAAALAAPALSAALPAALASPAAPLAAALAPAPSAPAVPAGAPNRAAGAVRAASPARAAAKGTELSEAARETPGRLWDGALAGRGMLATVRPREGEEFAAVRRLAAPFRTKVQLSLLARTTRPAGESYRFAIIGDAEPGRFWFWRALFNRDPGAFWKQLARADRTGADFILQLGDMVSRGILSNFRTFFEGLRAAVLRTPYLTVIGNHDRHRPHGVSNSRVYGSLFGSTNYAFERGGRRFVVVDNSAGRVTHGQLEWLRSVLPEDRSAIVFTHMPPAPLGEWTDFAGRKGAGGFREGADEFMRLMSDRKVARVYVGHVHGLGVLERGGVRYVLTGGGGSPLYPGPVKDRFHHFLTVDDGPNGLVETVHRSDGASFVLMP